MALFATRHAAIIGINAYESGIAPLKSAVADACAIASALKRDHGYGSPHLLLNGEATGAAILHLLEETLPAAVDAEGAVILYYAGHGVALGDGGDGPNGFLLPQDARPGDESTWLSMERVRQALSRLACKHLLVVLDCCFAGSFRWASSRSFVPVGQPLYDSQYARFLAGTAWQALTSASHQERALDVAPGSRNSRDGGAGNGHSPFAAALLKGLKGEADSSRGCHEPDGVITATELHQFIFEELVPPGSRSRQTPGIWPLKPENSGEFLFLVPGRERTTRPDPPLDDANNPWLGLRAYGRKDASLFFGRERVVDEILGRLLDPLRPPLLAVVGASGTGKSSVVRAGVLPRLAEPPEGQAETIGAWTVARLPRLQGNPGAQLDAVLRELKEIPPGRRRLLFIDQFEELYTQCPDGEIRAGFLRRLRELITGEDPLKLLITLRSDFEPRFAASEELGELLATARYLVPGMTSEELRDVIEEPAKAKALYFEPEALVGELVDEVMAMPGGLPLLSFALAEMYRQAQLRRRATGALDRAITRADCKAAGGVVGALHRRASELYEAADPSRRETIRRLFLRMVAQEGGRLARRRVEERELEYADPEEQARVRQVLEDYVEARLLVADGGYVEPAHDTLILAWEKLLDWLAEEGSQDLVRQLWGAASAWEAAQRGKGDKGAVGLLWNQDPRLPLVRERYLAGSGRLNRLEKEFAQRSVARKRSRRTLVIGITAAVILALSAATLYSRQAQLRAESSTVAERKATAKANDERKKAVAAAAAERAAKSEAEKKRREAEEAAAAERQARQRAQDTARVAMAGEGLPRDPTRAALVLLEVTRPDETAYAVARLREVLSMGLSAPTFRGHEGPVASASFSPDGRLFVTASGDKTARVWSVDGSGEPVVLRGHEEELLSASFSPDGTRIVTVSGGSTRVWVADGSGEPVVLRGHQGWLSSASFSPDGRRIVTTAGNTAQVWMADGSGEPVILRGHEEKVFNASFSPDGRRVVTASMDQTARVWWSDGSGEPIVLRGHEGWVLSAEFSPDGRRVATASGDQTARVWSLDGSSAPVVLRGHQGVVFNASFSRDGSRIVTASNDNTARVWWADGSRSAEPVILQGHEQSVRSASFSRDGRRVVTFSDDKTARVWPADGFGEPMVLRGHQAWVLSASFSPDGRRVVTASKDETARVWSVDTDEPAVLRGHQRGANASFSSDGRRVVTTSSKEKTARIWSADGSGEPVVLRGHEGEVLGASFSSDGRRVVTASRDQTARVWSADGSGGSVILRGHEGEVSSASFSSDGRRVVTASRDQTARVWSADGSGGSVVLRGHGGEVPSASFSPDGRRVVTASGDKTARIWSANGSGAPVVLRGHEGEVASASFSPDGRRVVTASKDKTARVWSADGSGDPVVLRGHEREVRTASFSPDGRRVVTTGSSDGTARVWLADGSGDPVVLRGRKEDWVSGASFSPDGRRVVTVSGDGTVRVWAVSGSLLQALVRAATPACLEPEVRVTYLGEPEGEARATYERCRYCVGPWRRRFKADTIRAAPDEAWDKWRECMNTNRALPQAGQPVVRQE